MSIYLMLGKKPKKSIPTRKRTTIEPNIAHMDCHDIARSILPFLSSSFLVVLSSFSPKFPFIQSRMASFLGSSLESSDVFLLEKKILLPNPIILPPEIREAKED